MDANVMAALEGVASPEELKTWEDVIGKSGTLVARRVWGIFFSEANREKWLDYLCRQHQLSREQAILIFSRVCYLPASKRKPHDTYWTLTGTNMVHTEFPNHQENVRKTAEEPGFTLENYVESITGQFPPEVLAKLNTIPDFRKGYELNRELNQILGEAGIPGDFGTGGHTPEQWPDFGSVQKTLGEFTGAYDKFRDDILGLIKQVARSARAAKQAAGKRVAKTAARKRSGRQ
jgi:hypothetical protein